MSIPDVDSEDAGAGGGLANDVGLQDDLKIPLVPVFRGSPFEFGEGAGVGEEGAGSFGPVLEDAGEEDHDFAGVGIEEAGDDGVVDVAVGGGPDAGEGPGAGVLVAVDDGEALLAGGELFGVEGEAEIAGHFEGPLVVERADEEGGVFAEFSEAEAAADADR